LKIPNYFLLTKADLLKAIMKYDEEQNENKQLNNNKSKDKNTDISNFIDTNEEKGNELEQIQSKVIPDSKL